MGNKTVVIMPAFNEEKTIGEVIAGIKNSLPLADIIVIIDESTDRTPQIAKKMGAIVIRLPLKMGMGCAIHTGFKYAYRHGYNFVVRIDSDGQHMPQEINKLISPVLKGDVDVTIGSRYLENSVYRTPLVRKGVMTALAYVISLIYAKRFTDTTSGFKAMNRKAIVLLSENYPTIGGTPTLIVLRWGGLRVSEVAVAMKQREAGTSYLTSMRKLAYVFRVFAALLALLLKEKDFDYSEGELR